MRMVALCAFARSDHVLIARKARWQSGPSALRGGKGTPWPMRSIATIPPDASGYRGAVTLSPRGNAQASCPCWVAQVENTVS